MARQFAARGPTSRCARGASTGSRNCAPRSLAASPARTVVVRALDVDDHDAVFRVFRELADELGGLDRVIVNAGLGKGAPVGTGRFDVNQQTITTNLLSALAQCEAAMEHFRAAGAGHLVVVSSVSALRGTAEDDDGLFGVQGRHRGVAEGLRAEMIGRPITVTTLFPGYIRSEMNDQVAQRTPLMASTRTACARWCARSSARSATAAVPPWPWRAAGRSVRAATRRCGHPPSGLTPARRRR